MFTYIETWLDNENKLQEFCRKSLTREELQAAIDGFYMVACFGSFVALNYCGDIVVKGEAVYHA